MYYQKAQERIDTHVHREAPKGTWKHLMNQTTKTTTKVFFHQVGSAIWNLLDQTSKEK